MAVLGSLFGPKLSINLIPQPSTYLKSPLLLQAEDLPKATKSSCKRQHRAFRRVHHWRPEGSRPAAKESTGTGRATNTQRTASKLASKRIIATRWFCSRSTRAHQIHAARLLGGTRPHPTASNTPHIRTAARPRCTALVATAASSKAVPLTAYPPRQQHCSVSLPAPPCAPGQLPASGSGHSHTPGRHARRNKCHRHAGEAAQVAVHGESAGAGGKVPWQAAAVASIIR